MGVMACSRRDCENILCDRYSTDHGYICNECFEELVNNNVLDIDNFVQTPRKDIVHLICDRSIYEEIFRKN